MSKTREGLDRLLQKHPDADIVEIKHQRLKAELMDKLIFDFNLRIPDPSGPWTTIVLYEDEKYVDFAIWNMTGNVYEIDEKGAVYDDPFIVITTSQQLEL